MGCRFVPGCIHAQQSHTCEFCRFFLAYLQDHGLLRTRNFASMTVWRDDVSSLYLKRNERVYEQVKGGFSLLLN